MPHQHVGVARGAIDVRDECIEPDDRRGERRGRPMRHRIESHGTGQIVERDVEAAAGADQVLDLGVGLGACQIRIELDQHDLRHRQIGGAADLAGEELRNQRLRSLPGTAELEHIHPIVVCFHDRGHGPALAERGDVAGDGDGAQWGHCCSWKLSFKR
jgi:hypothetical protein